MNDWFTMASAPRDGTVVRLYKFEDGYLDVCAYWSFGNRWVRVSVGDLIYDDPEYKNNQALTYDDPDCWQPLSEGPEWLGDKWNVKEKVMH